MGRKRGSAAPRSSVPSKQAREELHVVRELSEEPLVKQLTANYTPIEFDSSALLARVPRAYRPGTRQPFDLRVSPQSGRWGPSFASERELVQNAYDRAVELAHGADINCVHFEDAENGAVLYGLVSSTPVSKG